jgi:hypothetical protein
MSEQTSVLSYAQKTALEIVRDNTWIDGEKFARQLWSSSHVHFETPDQQGLNYLRALVAKGWIHEKHKVEEYEVPRFSLTIIGKKLLELEDLVLSTQNMIKEIVSDSRTEAGQNRWFGEIIREVQMGLKEGQEMTKLLISQLPQWAALKRNYVLSYGNARAWCENCNHEMSFLGARTDPENEPFLPEGRPLPCFLICFTCNEIDPVGVDGFLLEGVKPTPQPESGIYNVIASDSSHYWREEGKFSLICPVCKEMYVHIGTPTHRKEFIVIPVSCEFGHSYFIQMEGHKGFTSISIDVSSEKNTDEKDTA